MLLFCSCLSYVSWPLLQLIYYLFFYNYKNMTLKEILFIKIMYCIDPNHFTVLTILYHNFCFTGFNKAKLNQCHAIAMRNLLH